MSTHRILLLTASLFFLAACSESPQPTANKKAEPVKPPEPVTGQFALYQMYNFARSWAPDLQAMGVRSVRLPQVQGTAGKSGAWEATFVSPGKGRGRLYTYSVVEAEGNLHQGVFGGIEESYSGPRGQNKPFPVTVVRVDPDKAYEVALKHGAEYVKAHPDMPITFMLELTPRNPNPTWRVLWGESVARSSFSVLVDSVTGDYVGTLR